MLSAADKLAAELGEDKPARAPATGNGDGLFTRANGVSTVAVLGWLGISHEETNRGVMATCPGCGEDGALVCKEGGLKCLHDRCAHVGPAKNRGFRTPVDVVAHVRQVEPHEAARRICEHFGIDVPNRAITPKPHEGTVDETAPDADEDLFEGRWVQLGERHELLTDVPPQTDWLLTRWHEGRTVGVLPRSKTGLINSTGGLGKTYALIQLALAQATGGFWLETFRAAKPGHVLLALAEEELDEAQRRLWRAANALELTPEARRQAAHYIDLLPLHGVPVALTCSPAPGIIAETAVSEALRKRLDQRGVDWSLVILDPLSRWAGGGVEGNNEVATRFCQVIERLTSVRGKPSVIVSHHSSQASTRAGESDARGVTAIRDGFRWQATMDAVEEAETGAQGLRFRNRKSNYSLAFPELVLVRNTDPGIEGTLRLASTVEAEGLSAKGGSREVGDDEMKARVLATVAKRPGLTSANSIAEVTQGSRGRVIAAVKALRFDGRLEMEGGSLVVREPGEANR